MATTSIFHEWLQAAYDIADEQLLHIALPVGTYTAKSILNIQSKQNAWYKGANYANRVRNHVSTETKAEDDECVLLASTGATYRCNRSTIFKVVTELESKAGVPRKAIHTWKVEDQRKPKQQFFINLPCKKTTKGFSKMTKKSILAYSLKESAISGKDELGNLITIPVVQESDQQLPDFIFKMQGLDLEHLYGDITVTLYYDVDEMGDYKDVVLTLTSEDNWLVGLDSCHTDKKGWRRAFQYYPKSYEDDRDYRPSQESTPHELEDETKSQAILPAKEESSSVENNEAQSPSPTVNNDDALVSQDYPSTQSIDSVKNHQESTLTDTKAESGPQLETDTHSNINQDMLESIMTPAKDRSNLEGFDDPSTEESVLANPDSSTGNKRDDSSTCDLDKLMEEICGVADHSPPTV